MIIALSIWNDRIAPVFDVALHLLLIEIEGQKIVRQSLEELPSRSIMEKIIKLQQLGIDNLMCGAVSREVNSFLDIYGINVTAFISGDIQEIIQLYLSGNFDEAEFAMPGCAKQKKCKNKQLVHCRQNGKSKCKNS